MTSVDKEQSDSEESAPAPTQSSLWRRVNISLFVALLALLVSGLGFYFQFIHVDQALYLTISRHEFNEKGMVGFDATFSNGGNRTIAIPDIWITVNAPGLGSMKSGEVFGTKLNTIVLKPGEADTERLCVAIESFVDLTVDAEEPVEVILTLEIVTAAGRSFIAETDIFAFYRDPDKVTFQVEDGELVGGTLGYFVLARRSAINLLHDARPQDEVFMTTIDSEFETELKRLRQTFLEQVRVDAGCPMRA